MKTVGLITEYNPFHNGHKYHLEKAKELTGADYAVVIMSGDFTQRGYPAITDKFTRAHMALAEGADIVIELPVVYSTASAWYFALGAVSILQNLGCIDSFVFGSECGELTSLKHISDFLQEEPAAYQHTLKSKLSTGISYPVARVQAIVEHFGKNQEHLLQLLQEPNNILALEYLQALKYLNSPITPYTIKRLGASYHQHSLSEEYGSASGIRNALSQPKYSLCALKNQIPPEAFKLFSENLALHSPVWLDDFSAYLSYCLISEPTEFSQILDIDEFLARRIRNSLDSYQSISSFADLLKSKNYTHTRMTRCLCHILLQIKSEDLKLYENNGICYYARVLGFQKSSAPLLKSMKNNSAIPLITKLSVASSTLNQTGSSMLEKDLYASKIYHSVQKNGMAYNEYATPLIIL